MNQIRTYAGRQWIDPLDPGEFFPFIEDIALSLSRQRRYLGHTKTPWTVGQHSLVCYRYAKLVAPEARRHALFHDAAEAYLGDIVSPVKHRLAEIEAADVKLSDTIFRSFKVPREHGAVSSIDYQVMTAERYLLCRGDTEPLGTILQLVKELQWTMEEGIRELFLAAEAESR